MSNIQPPNFNNSNYDYPPYGGSTLRELRTDVDPSSMGGDPWGNYGLNGSGDPSLGGQNSALQQYAYDRQLALQSLQNGNLDPQTRKVWQNYLNELDRWFQQYGSAAQSMGGELGSTGMGDGNGIPSSLPPMSFQNPSIVGWDDDVPEITASKTDYPGRVKEFFGYGDVNFTVKGSAKAHVTMEEDPAGSGIKVPVVTVTWPSDGTTQRYVFSNSAHVHVLADSPDKQVTIDTAVPAELVDKNTIGDSADSQPQGDQPTKRKDGKLGWDGKSFDIYSTMDGKDKYISARDEVHFHASSNSEYWAVNWNDQSKQYEVTVFSDPEMKTFKETFTVDDMTNLKMTFDIDPSHITFQLPLCKGPGDDSHVINTSDPHGKKLSFDKGSGTGGANDPTNPNPAPDVPSQDGEKTLTYNKNASPTFTNYFDDPNATNDPNNTVTYNISASGTIKISPASQDDHFHVSKSSDGKYYIITATGKDSNGDPKTIIYKVDASKVSMKVELDGIDPNSSVDFDSSLGDDDKKKFVTSDGKTIAEAQKSQTSNQSGNGALPKNIQDLLTTTGVDYNTFIATYQKYYQNDFNHADADHDGKVTPQELADAINKGVIPPFPPPMGRSHDEMVTLFSFLKELDAQFGDAMSTVTKGSSDGNHENNGYDDERRKGLGGLKAAGPRLAQLLANLYQGSKVSWGGGDDPLSWNDIRFTDSQGNQTNFNFTWEHVDDNWWMHGDFDFTTFP